MALLKRELHRQVKGPEITHADRCTLVFDTDTKRLYVESEVAHLEAKVGGTVEYQTTTMDIADYLTQGGQTAGVPGRHVRRVRRPVGTGTKEPVVVVGVDVMSLHHPHQMHRIGAAGKAAVSVVYVVADRLGAGEPLRADSNRAGAMLRLRHAMRHRPGFLAAG